MEQSWVRTEAVENRNCAKAMGRVGCMSLEGTPERGEVCLFLKEAGVRYGRGHWCLDMERPIPSARVVWPSHPGPCVGLASVHHVDPGQGWNILELEEYHVDFASPAYSPDVPLPVPVAVRVQVTRVHRALMYHTLQHQALSTLRAFSSLTHSYSRKTLMPETGYHHQRFVALWPCSDCFSQPRPCLVFVCSDGTHRVPGHIHPGNPSKIRTDNSHKACVDIPSSSRLGHHIQTPDRVSCSWRSKLCRRLLLHN